MAYIYGAAKKSNAAPDITVLDHCATPLFACRWFAKHYGFSIKTIQTDVFEALKVTGGNFDLVTSDAFLTRFNSEAGKRVVSLWHSLLSDIGQIVTTVRLHGSAVEVRDQERAVADFVSKARTRIPRWKQFIRRPSQEILSAIEHYARRMVSNKLGDERDLIRLLQENGLAVISTELGDVPGELYPTVYLRIVAERLGTRV